MNRVLQRSIRYSLEPANRRDAVVHSMQWGRGMEESLADQFVGMYVNALTLEFGDRGRAGVRRFLDEAHKMGFIPEPVALEFVGD